MKRFVLRAWLLFLLAIAPLAVVAQERTSTDLTHALDRLEEELKKLDEAAKAISERTDRLNDVVRENTLLSRDVRKRLVQFSIQYRSAAAAQAQKKIERAMRAILAEEVRRTHAAWLKNRSSRAGHLVLSRPDGSKRKNKFKVTKGDTETAVSKIHKYVVAWGDMEEAPELKIELKDGSAFSVASTTCPKHLSFDGSCEISIQMKASTSGRFSDRLIVSVRSLKKRLNLSGVAEGWIGGALRWVNETSLDPLVVQASSGTGSLVLQVQNTGSRVIAPIKPRLDNFDVSDRFRSWWSLDPQSTCMTQDIAPGAICDLWLNFRPLQDGQDATTIKLPFDSSVVVDEEVYVRSVYGYGRGFNTLLPKNVLINGDACPMEGQSAEVVRDLEDARVVEHQRLRTATCSSWVRSKKGRYTCAGTERKKPMGTSRIYERDALDAPWKLIRTKDRHITPYLRCKDGVITHSR